MTGQSSVLNTVGAIAARLGVPIHKIEYVIRARDMTPPTRAGSMRVFSDEQVNYIADQLATIAQQREGRSS